MEGDSMTATAVIPIPAEKRRELMDVAEAEWVRGGWRVESRSDYQAVFSKGKRPNHILHLILTLVTVGLWGIVWIFLALTSHEKRQTVSVDEYGQRSGR
jgi:Na+-transporting NADH:ubiquinone oxidoreductase subunit NqrC